MDWREFESKARDAMNEHFNTNFREGTKDDVKNLGHPKKFDMVSPDGKYVGDAKYLALVHRERYPPAKMMEICAHVWLLEKVPKAAHRFMVFGNQRRVPEWWLETYGNLPRNVKFYFLDVETHGKPELL